MNQESRSDLNLSLNKSDKARLASTLLERQPIESYIHEWTDLLRKKEDVKKQEDRISVVVFRLGQEWLALNTIYFKEVLPSRPIHRIPHRTGKILLGVANLGGELQPCMALHRLLEIDISITKPKRNSYQSDRMIALAKDNEVWIVPVDEVEGIHNWYLSSIGNVPVNIVKSSNNYLKGIMTIANKSIGLLDEELLFYSLKRSL
ncbi:chemotaxis protein CheW [Candidatus Protochlamydia phocaeensis]|uniref:chemotaxis protein CheW n=1 Tax=Candidatus Protochlamydia phocaeensis TaxID=1414722 RepID=UPI00083939B5|nr:chemotaxis protein CheW [Candidatus Protochlamydia phocaeensis]